MPGPCYCDGQNRLRQMAQGSGGGEVPPELDEIDALAWPQTLNAVGQPRMTTVSALASNPRHSGHDSQPPDRRLHFTRPYAA